MDLIEYHPMLRHDNATAGSTAQCRAGSPPVCRGAAVPAGPGPSGGHAGARGDAADGASVVSPLAPARVALVTPTAGPPSPRARRAGHPAVERHAVARGKKNARRQRAWLVFEDESGVSQLPVVRRTWAPRGQTPVLTHTGGSWQRLS